MNKLNEKQLFTCTGFDFFVDHCERCNKKMDCVKYEELMNCELGSAFGKASGERKPSEADTSTVYK